MHPAIFIADRHSSKVGTEFIISTILTVTGGTPIQYIGALVGEAGVEELRPIRERYEQIIKDKKQLEELYKTGAAKAERTAIRTLSKAMKKVGFVL